jgi:hypothetical protein
MSTTSKLGADMTDEQIERLAQTHLTAGDDGEVFGVVKFARALLARRPAAIDNEATWAPERIWLQRGIGEEGSHTWCEHQIGEDSIGEAIEEAEYVRVDAAPLANEASKPAPLVEQDERGAISEHDAKGLEIIASWMDRDGLIEPAEFLRNLAARAASTSANVGQLDMSLEARLADAEADVKRLHAEKMELWNQVHGYSANVAQPQSVDLPPRVIDQLYQAAGVSTYHPDGDQQEKLHAFARNVVAETLARLPTANVAQGAVAVATVKVYETYTGQNGWIEVTQEEYDRTKDKYEHRIRRVSAPPAQTALTDAARDVLAERCRQVEAEGFTTARDDGYADGQLAQAGAAYALAVADHTNHTINSGAAFYTRSPDIWPWSEKWWKPTSPRRALVKAGALILAEIERLDRRALTAAQPASEGNHAG